MRYSTWQLLLATKHEQYTVVKVEGPSGYDTVSGTLSLSNASRVPVGSHRLPVDQPEAYSVGDLVLIERPGTEEWIAMIGMDVIPDCTPPLPGRSCSQWSPNRYNFDWERTVVGVEGHSLVLDAPLVEPLDQVPVCTSTPALVLILPHSLAAIRPPSPCLHHQVYGGRTVKTIRDRRISHVGIERLQMRSSFDASLVEHDKVYNGRNIGSYYYDEAHAWRAVVMDNVEHAWVSRLSCHHFGFACVDLEAGSKHVTVENSTYLDPVSVLTGGRRYSFNNNGQLNLVRYSTSDYGRHSFVTGSNPGGPNVFYRCSSTNDQSDIGPHMLWAVGQLYDNIFGGQMRVWDRGFAGSGHGWSGNTIVFWNCHSLASLGALCCRYAPCAAFGAALTPPRCVPAPLPAASETARAMSGLPCPAGGTNGFRVDSPATGANYCVGCVSDTETYDTTGPWCCGVPGSYQSHGARVEIDSLYDAQLAERLRAGPEEALDSHSFRRRHRQHHRCLHSFRRRHRQRHCCHR